MALQIVGFFSDDNVTSCRPDIVNEQVAAAECVEVTEGDCNVLLHQRQFSFMWVQKGGTKSPCNLLKVHWNPGLVLHVTSKFPMKVKIPCSGRMVSDPFIPFYGRFQIKVLKLPLVATAPNYDRWESTQVRDTLWLWNPGRHRQNKTNNKTKQSKTVAPWKGQVCL